MRHNRMPVIGLLIAIACRSRAAMALGDNLLPNPDFDTDISEWTEPYGDSHMGLAWSHEDAGGDSASGSAKIDSGSDKFEPHTLRSRCMAVTGGAQYRYGGDAKLESDLGGVGTVEIGVTWYSDDTCPSGTPSESILYHSYAWTKKRHTATAPANANSATIDLEVTNHGGGPSGFPTRAVFDNVLFAATETDDTTTTTLVCDGTCGDPVVEPTEQGADASTTALVTASDALFILQAAIGAETCAPCTCDVDDSGGISATDALIVLDAAAGAPVGLACPN